jgi:hypothetical protein
VSRCGQLREQHSLARSRAERVLWGLGAPGAAIVSGDVLEAGMKRFAGWSIPNSLPARVRDHDKLNLDRVFANPREWLVRLPLALIGESG